MSAQIFADKTNPTLELFIASMIDTTYSSRIAPFLLINTSALSPRSCTEL